jgi:hypothetical protein
MQAPEEAKREDTQEMKASTGETWGNSKVESSYPTRQKNVGKENHEE